MIWHGWIAAALFIAVSLAMFAIALRFSRPDWGRTEERRRNVQAIGSRMERMLYGVAVAHVLLGLAAVIALGLSTAALGVFVIAVVMAGFYVGCANAPRLAATQRKPTTVER